MAVSTVFRFSCCCFALCVGWWVGLKHVAVMFVCWFVSTVLLDFLVVVVFLVVCIDFD